MKHTPLVFVTTLAFLFSPLTAHTDVGAGADGHWQNDQHPKVFYFGGYIAQPGQVAQWKKGAKLSNPNYEYKAFPWPAGVRTAGSEAAQTDAAMVMIRSALKEMLDVQKNRGRKWVVVGHSSGAALSNRLVSIAIQRNPDLARRIKLIALDGFIPSQSLRSKVDTVCVNAKSRHGHSRNFSAMTNCKGGKSRVWTYEDKRESACRTPWCGHFVMVTKAALPGLGKNWPSSGYNNAATKANVDWLDK